MWPNKIHMGLKRLLNNIEVTSCDVQLNPKKNERLKGFATIILNDSFAVHKLKVIQMDTGLFVAMPSRRRGDGIFHDVAHPICQELRDFIENVVLEKYHQMFNDKQNEKSHINDEIE